MFHKACFWFSFLLSLGMRSCYINWQQKSIQISEWKDHFLSLYAGLQGWLDETKPSPAPIFNHPRGLTLLSGEKKSEKSQEPIRMANARQLKCIETYFTIQLRAQCNWRWNHQFSLTSKWKLLQLLLNYWILVTIPAFCPFLPALTSYYSWHS